MVKAVIFDLDGLMVDSESIWSALWEPACADLGVPLDPQFKEDVRGSSGEGMYAIMRRYWGDDFDCDRLYHAEFDRMAEWEKQNPMPVKPGLYPLLDWLEQQNIPKAVASSSPGWSVENILGGLDLERRFAAIITGDRVSNGKPSPEVFLLAAEALGVAPADCLVLEDSFNGVRAGRAAGMLTVMIPDIDQPTPEIRALAHAVLPDLLAVRDALAAGTLPPLQEP